MLASLRRKWLPRPWFTPRCARQSGRASARPSLRPRVEALEDRINPAPALLSTIEGITFDENGANNAGFFSIPPDPHGAVGPAHVVSVVNRSIEFHEKAGGSQVSSVSLSSFFTPVGLISGTSLFDSKAIYDPHADRFVVVSLEKKDSGVVNDPTNVSRILLAVSDDSIPVGTWYYYAIDAKEVIGGNACWADFPGFAVDEEAVYVTGNMFNFGAGGPYAGSRLFTVSKAGLYDGLGTPTVLRRDPYALAGLSSNGTLQPAMMYAPGPGTVGTFLVNSGWISGAIDFLAVIRVDNPLTTPTFTNQFINLGDVHNGSAIPAAPQLGTATLIDAGDLRVQNAVWRNNQLYVANTVAPPSGSDAGQATAHWYRINTTSLASLTLADQGNVGGEDLGGGTYTFFPAVTVDGSGNMGVSFAASNPAIYAGAYYTGRLATDPAGTIQSSGTLAAGLDYYIRTFGGPRNRWGDFSGISIDPANSVFWVFNEYALSRGTIISGEDGRWGNRWGSFTFSTLNLDPTLALTGSATAYSEGGTPTLLDSSGFVYDPDSANFDTGKLIVSFTANGTSDDRLAIRNQGTGAGQIGVSGSTVTFGGTTIGSFSGGTDGSTPLLITLNANATMAAAQALLRNITFQNVSDAPSTAARAVQFVLQDGDGGISAAAIKSVTVSAVNDAPVLDTNGNPVLAAVLEDPVSNLGTLVADLIVSDGNRITDADGSLLRGIAVTAVVNTNGSWEYSLNNGSNWLAFGAPSVGLARLLAADAVTRVRFVPSANFNGMVAGLSFRAWDQTSGSSGSTADTSVNGGTTAFSTAIETASITVRAVNDQPTFTAASPPAVNEDAGAQTVIGWSTFDAGQPDESGQTVLGYTVSNMSNPGLFAVAPAVANNGTLTYTLVANAFGTCTFDVAVRDSGGTADGGVDTSLPQTFTLTVNAVNDVPSFTVGPNIAVNEDAGIQSIGGWATAISAGPPNEVGQSVTFQVTANTNPGLFSAGPAVNASGMLTYTPMANANGSATITIRLIDNGGTANAGTDTSATQSFTITVTAVNDAPSFTKGADQTINEDAGAQSVSGWATAPSAGPPDEGSQTLSFIITGNSNPGLFAAGPAVSSTGTLTYTPSANANGTATVTLQVMDSGGTANGGVNTSAAQTFLITVNVVNDAPSFTKGTDQTVNEDAGAQTVGSWATALSAGPPDEFGQTLTFQVTGNTNPTLFAVSPTVSATGTLSYTPTANANGSATITIRLTDNGGTANGGADTSASQTFVITVNAVNDAPSFTKGADQMVNEDSGAQTVAGWATALSPGPSNEAGQTLEFVVIGNSNPSLFSAAPAVNSIGTLMYTPAANTSGFAILTVVLTDNGGTANGGVDTSGAQTFVITVNPVNDAPSFVKGADPTVNEDAGPQTIAGWATAISAGPPNEAGQGLAFLATGNTNPGLFAAGPAISASGTLTYTPAAHANGSATITLVLMDSGGTANGGVDTSATQSFTITVNAVNDAPSFFKGPDQTVNEDAAAQTVTGWATGIAAGPPDESGQTSTFVVTGNTNPGLFAALPAIGSAGTLTYMPAANANGTATVTIQLQDNGGTANGGVNTSATQSFTITVNAINDAPSFVKGANQVVNEDAGAQSVTGWASSISAGPANEGSQTLTFIVTGNTNSGLFAVAPAVSAAGTLTYTPTTNANGTATITLALQDSGGGTTNGGVDTSATQSFTITVDAVNDVPSFIKGANQVVNEDAGAQIVTGWATGIAAGPPDESSQTLTFAVTGNTNSGLFAAGPAISAAGALTYTPAPNANGTATITIVLQDNGGTANGGVDTSASQSFTITVNPVNDTPSFTKGADQAVNEDVGAQMVAGWATALSAGPANEAGQTLTFVVTANNNPTLFAAGPAINSSGMLSYTPAANASGFAIISVVVMDNGGTANGGVDSSPAQTFAITINPGNDAPSFTKGVNQVVNEDAGAQSVTGWATGIAAGPADESAQGLTFVVTGNTNPGLFAAGPAVSAAGTLTYTPAAHASGSATITLVLMDSGGTANGGVDTSATQSFTITANAVNDAPSFVKGSNQSVNEDAGPQTMVGWANGISAGPANESGQTVAFTVTGNTNPGLFAVGPAISATGILTYTPAANANGSATITIQLQDNGGTANSGVDTSAAQSFTISINAVNDPPIFVKGPNQSVNEDSGAQSVAGWAIALSAGPVDESGQTLSFVVTGNTNPGLFNAGPVVSASGTLTYTPAANANGMATITLVLMDNGGTTNGGMDTGSAQSFTITVNAVNDAPSFTKGPEPIVSEDAGPQTMSNWATAIAAGPADESGQLLTFLVTGNTNPGLFAAGPVLDSAGTLTYTPAANAHGTATISIVLQDSGGTANGGVNVSTAQTYTISVNAVNDAPVLDSTGGPMLTPIPRNFLQSIGDTVASFANSAITDPDAGAVAGIAVVAVSDPAQGAWQFSIDGSATWVPFGPVSASAARLLLDTNSVRFVPAANFVGTPTLSYRAWDQTSGLPGGNADLSSPGAIGGTTAFSTALESASLKVAMTLKTIKEDTKSPAGNKISKILSGAFKAANPAAAKGIAVVGLTGTANGTWQFSTNGGKTWKSFSSFGTMSETNALLLRVTDQVRFVPAANFYGTASISYHAWNRSVGSPGTTANVLTGGTTFSTGSDCSLVVVTSVNDRPVLDDSGSPTLTQVSGSDPNPPGDTVASFAAALISDGGDPESLVGIAVVGLTGTTSGTWQFLLNGSTTWQNLGPVSSLKARLLRDIDRIRFVANPGFVGTATITFGAWDQFTGVPGGLVAPAGTAFSKALETASVQVTS